MKIMRETMNDSTDFLSTPTKEIGVEFTDLTPRQQAMLNEVLTYHLENEARTEN